jgi:hypothetical protein
MLPRLLLTLSALAASACFQEVDMGADARTRAQNGPPPLATAIDDTQSPIGLSNKDDNQVTAVPCVKVRQDKTYILEAYCAGCHGHQPAQGLPPWDFVLDDQRLVTEVWQRAGQPDQHFVIPGDPDHSALYTRAATDMPPVPTDLGTQRAPWPTASDLSVLREWIMRCL